MNEYIISIDPSINKIGWALYRMNDSCLLEFGTWKTKNPKSSLVNRMESLKEELFIWGFEINNLDSEGVYNIVIEVPDTWTRNGKNTGSLFKLNFAAGWLAGYLTSSVDIFGNTKSVNEVRVSQWKGKTRKVKTQQMVNDIFQGKIPKMNDHEADAIGIALWFERQLKLKKMEM